MRFIIIWTCFQTAFFRFYKRTELESKLVGLSIVHLVNFPPLLKSSAQPHPWAFLWSHHGLLPKWQPRLGLGLPCCKCSVNVEQTNLCKTIVFWVVLDGTNEMSPYRMLFWSIISCSECFLQLDWNKNGNVIFLFHAPPISFSVRKAVWLRFKYNVIHI